ncbi:LOW QUALITY PROTEIN: Helitron helicase, partial [Phytophthora megakarya]
TKRENFFKELNVRNLRSNVIGNKITNIYGKGIQLHRAIEKPTNRVSSKNKKEVKPLRRIEGVGKHDEERRIIQQRDTAAHKVARNAVTEEENECHKEAERFRCRSRQYQRRLSYYEGFDPSIIPGGRHYFSRYTGDTQEHEQVCSLCNAWKFSNETDGSCCRNGLVSVPAARWSPVELRRLYRNPGFKQLIQAYNNVSAFTSVGSSRFRPLNVDESITRSRSGVYNFGCKGVSAAKPEASILGHKVIRPPTFTGGPRYMYQRFLDAMAIVRETGAPNLFITMTCNPNGPEIKETPRRGEQASDRPGLVARVFMQNLRALNQDLDEGVLGIVAAKVYVVEYQNRGLPHAHILLILRPEDKSESAEDVDRLISAELPDKEKHPELYETVISNMLHGPCGQQNPNCPCMKNGKCSKQKFPKVFGDETVMAENKYPTYMRRPRREELLSIRERCGLMPR